MESKYCKECRQTKPIKGFYKYRTMSDGLSFYCKECSDQYHRQFKQAHPAYYKAYAKEYYKNYRKTTQGRYTRLRFTKRKAGIPFEITNKEFIEWFDQQKRVCHYCGQALVEDRQGSTLVNSLNIDRKDNKQGYKLDNIVLACRKCNTIKGNWLTYEQMLEIAERYFR